MDNQTMTVFIVGWIFLVASWIWPTDKWGGRAVRMALASFSLGLFAANAIHQFVIN
jgi:hypothetical protein